MINSLSMAAAGGIIAGKLAYGAMQQFSHTAATKIAYAAQTTGSANTYAWVAFGIGLAVAVAIFLYTYKEEKQEIVNFKCLPWEPAIGGADCEECNKDVMRPCTEYRCKSLGQACELINPGTTEEACVYKGRNE